jgi:hypothetical protein
MHGARTALTTVTALLRTRDIEAFTQRVQQRHTGIDGQPLGTAIDFKGDIH